VTALRSWIFAVWLFGGSFLLSLAYIPTLILPHDVVRVCLRFWGAFVLFGLRWICGVRVEIRGRQFIPQGPALIAAKHQGMLDVCAPFTIMPDVCYVMKKELLYIPFFGWYAWRGGMIFVDRAAQAAALKKLVRDTQERMRRDRQVLIFPEGTRRPVGAEPDYKPGVAALYRDLELPCTPVATNSGQHWPAKGLMRYPGTVVFEFLPPIPAGLKRGEFMKALEASIEPASARLASEAG